MPPLSRSQIDELGRRLRRSDPTVEDLGLLERVRSLYEEPLTEVVGVLVDLHLEPGSRSKTTGTIIDKLRRMPNLELSRLQDLWAQIVERLADEWGRGIRYGEPPSEPTRRLREMTRQEFVNRVMQLAEEVDVVEEVAGLRREYDRLGEELRRHGQAPPDPEEMAAVYARFAERERRVRAFLERLHDVIAPRTLGP